MAQKISQPIESFNPLIPLVDEDQLSGSYRVVADIAARDLIPSQKRVVGSIVSYTVSGNIITSKYIGPNTTDPNWTDPTNWVSLSAEAIEMLGADSGNPHGFINFDNTDNTISFDESTRTFTITPVAATFDYYIEGKKYTIVGAKSVIFPDLEGTHFFYLDINLDLLTSQSFETAGANAFVAVVYWDATNNLIIYEANERHTTAFEHLDWKYKHLTFGTQWRSGSALSAITPDATGNNNTDASFTADAGIIVDEDITHNLAQQTAFDLFYKLGVNGDWRRAALATPYGVFYNGTRAVWNQFTGGAWQQTLVANLDFVLAHVFATNNLISPYIVVMGQATYGSVAAARSGANNEMNNLITSGLPFQEFVPVASIIYQTANAYTNAVRSRIRTTDAGANYVNWLGQDLSPSVVPTAHNNLSGIQPAGVGVTNGHVNETLFGLIPTTDQSAAITGANAPSAANVFATMNDIPAASLTVAGKIELATQAEVTAGSDAVRAVCPSTLAGIVISETQKAMIEIATQAEVTTGTDDVRAVTPLKLATAVPAASESAAGKAEIATQAETNTGTDNARFVTPAKLAAFNGQFQNQIGFGVAPIASRPVTIGGTWPGASVVAMTNLDPTGFGLFIRPGDDTSVYGLAVSNAAGTSTSSNHPIRGFGDGNLYITGHHYASNGTELLPAFSFSGDPNTGFWSQAADVIGVSLGGDEKYRFTAGNFHAAADIISDSTTTPSDRRLKKNIKPLKNALSKLLNLAGVTFNLKKDKKKATRIGLIAQDVEKIFPEVVKEVEMIGNGKMYKTINYPALIPVLIEAIKEQQEQIEKLQQQVNKLT
ncbi:MAG: tail fiber domain-containing protein [Paludibacter sp.]|nr:tail fiber domain-containing protein [Paludibacter sp.]